MIKEHKICSMVIKVDSNVLIEFLNDMIADFRTLKDLHARLTEYKAGEMEEDEFEDYMLDVRFLSTNSFHNLSKLFICENQSINIYFSRTAYTFTDLTDLCSAISDRYCAPNEKETDSLLDLCYKTLAGFCFMLGNEFEKSILKSPNLKEMMLNHIRKHKKFKKIQDNEKENEEK